MSQRAAIRRRRQWSTKFRHLALIGRPIYPREISADKARRRDMAVVAKQQSMRQRKKKG